MGRIPRYKTWKIILKCLKHFETTNQLWSCNTQIIDLLNMCFLMQPHYRAGSKLSWHLHVMHETLPVTMSNTSAVFVLDHVADVDPCPICSRKLFEQFKRPWRHHGCVIPANPAKKNMIRDSWLSFEIRIFQSAILDPMGNHSLWPTYQNEPVKHGVLI